jgi:hypothetical protein
MPMHPEVPGNKVCKVLEGATRQKRISSARKQQKPNFYFAAPVKL